MAHGKLKNSEEMKELKKELMAVIAKYNGKRISGRWVFPAAVAGAAMCELSKIMDKIINHGDAGEV